MNNNLKGHNWGKQLTSEQAETWLTSIGFFNDEVNLTSFIEGHIEVFVEPWECQTSIIIHTVSQEVIFFNQRS